MDTWIRYLADSGVISLIGIGSTEGSAIQQLHRRLAKRIIDQPNSRIGGSAVGVVLVMAHSNIHGKFLADGIFVLGIKGPHLGAVVVVEIRKKWSNIKVRLGFAKFITIFGAHGYQMTAPQRFGHLDFIAPPCAIQIVMVDDNGIAVSRMIKEIRRIIGVAAVVKMVVQVHVFEKCVFITQVGKASPVRGFRWNTKDRAKRSCGYAFGSRTIHKLECQVFVGDFGKDLAVFIVVRIQSKAIGGRSVKFGKEQLLSALTGIAAYGKQGF